MNEIYAGMTYSHETTDWHLDRFEFVTKYVDEHTAQVYGEWGGIDICASVADHCVGVGLTVTIKDNERKGLAIVAGLNVDTNLFNPTRKSTPFLATVSAVREAVKYALTYATLDSNETGISITRLERAIRNFNNEFAAELDKRLTDEAETQCILDKASLVAA